MSTQKNCAPLLAAPRDDYVRDAARGSVATSYALLFHTSGNALQIVTAHAVIQDRNHAPIIASGHPLTSADERDILNLLTSRANEQEGFTAVYPERLLFADPTRTLWWMPSDVRPMHLRSTHCSVTIRARWPTLVLLAMDRNLYVAALETDDRPNAKTRLFHSTLPNIWSDGRVCTGDAKLPMSSTPADIPHWESVLLDSAFSHSNHQQALRADGGKRGYEDVEKFWCGRDKEVSAFPVKRLVPMKRTLAQWFANPDERA